MGVKNTKHAFDLFAVTLDSRWELFWVIGAEPDLLAKVWALARYLEVEPKRWRQSLLPLALISWTLIPLLEVILLRGRGVGKSVVLIVSFYQVLNNRARLVQS